MFVCNGVDQYTLCKTCTGNILVTNALCMCVGIVKECLRHKQVSFDNEALTRKESMKLLKLHAKGAAIDQLRQLRHSFKVPVDILVNLTTNQAAKVIARMNNERDAGGLRDIPKRSLFDDGATSSLPGGLKIDGSPGKRKCT